MEFEQKRYQLQELVRAYNASSLVRNPEYQRGAAWSRPQKQALIDSVFREYPLPPIFLEVQRRPGLGGNTTERYEIIDGQQRILALVEFFKDDFALLATSDEKLRLPLSLRSAESPWATKRYSDLSDELKTFLSESTILVYTVEDVQNSDEVRDLFIRLQSGTPLTRQQIRDAWPGVLGPRVEVWAGKLSKSPKYRFFTAVDGRGTRDDEDDTNDLYVKHRTTCAQLCALLLARAENPFAAPSIKAADLDSLYHRYTTVKTDNNPLDYLESIFSEIEEVVEKVTAKSHGRKKIPKIALFALAMFMQDAKRSSSYRLTTEAKGTLARETSEPRISQNSRASSGGVIKDYYERWRDALPPVGITLDPKRLFDDTDKQAIRKRDKGLCAICVEEVFVDDEEFDHYPLPHRDGGRTLPENGRLLHRECHPRGRPVDA